MHDPNRLMKWLLVLALVVLSLVILYPPSQKLKGGIDLVGGTSMLFEIDTTGLDAYQQTGLASRVMEILRERVDPKGQLNLEWRPVGNTRLEIRMPRPPKEALLRRGVYNAAIDRLSGKNVTRFAVESALHAGEGEQPAALAALIRGVPERTSLIETLAEAYAEHQASQESEDSEAQENASEAYEEAMSTLLATNIPINRFTDMLVLPRGEQRDMQLAKLRAEYPSCDTGTPTGPDGKLLTKAVSAYDAWAVNKADLEDPSDLKRRIRGAGVLEFRILADRDASKTHTTGPNPQPISKYTEQLAKYGPRPRAGDRYQWFPTEDIFKFMHVKVAEELEAAKGQPGRPIIDEYAGRYYVMVHSGSNYELSRRQKWKLRSAMPYPDPLTGRNNVSFTLDPRGGRLFGELTGTNINRELCIFLDGVAMSHATIQDRIMERGRITGDFSTERVQELVRTLEAGSLPARLKETPLMEKTIGPSLGETNRRHGIQAAVWGGIAVAVFVLIYYGIVGGGMVDVALAMNLLFVLSAMALMQATFTLPGVAGLILTVGMAIDANVLIFERIREERDRGVIFKKALNAGYEKAFSTIMDANLTTLITCVILGFVGSEEVKGFAIVLGIGIVTSMFTSLFVTRLVFNSLIVKGMLKDLSMRRLLHRPTIDWVALRSVFWPISIAVVALGVGLFVTQSTRDKEAVYDIEFLGGTSVQIDLKPEFEMSDEEVDQAITGTNGESAVQWLGSAAGLLEAAQAADGETPGQFTLTSSELTGDQLATLMRSTVEDLVERDGIAATGRTATFDGKSGRLDLAGIQDAITSAAREARQAADRLRNARVQSVGEIKPSADTGKSYEIVTVETNRGLVQEAIVAVLGGKLKIQQAVNFTTVRDEVLTKEEYFIVEGEDHYLSDVIGGDANFDIRQFRGGVAIEVVLDEHQEPVVLKAFERRLREIGLSPEFEQYRTRESVIFPLGGATTLTDGTTGYKRFAVLAVDETMMYDDDPILWAEELARTHSDQVDAALGSEKSLSKVVQFAPQIAGQTKNRAIFAIILALGAIVSYLWLRFGTKEYGLAAIVALVHDVGITLGLVALSHFVYATWVGSALGIDDFKIDLPMIAAILTVIGYSLNDTIVVFDRIRENRGRLGSLNPKLINNSINQTLSRTVLTSFTTFLVVAILYAFGGKGVHGFSFALLIGVIVGTYSSIAIATPLLYRPRLLRSVVAIIGSLILIGVVFAETSDQMWQLIWTGVIALVCVIYLVRRRGVADFAGAGQPAGA